MVIQEDMLISTINLIIFQMFQTKNKAKDIQKVGSFIHQSNRNLMKMFHGRMLIHMMILIKSNQKFRIACIQIYTLTLNLLQLLHLLSILHNIKILETQYYPILRKIIRRLYMVGMMMKIMVRCILKNFKRNMKMHLHLLI